jgi:hypothetical protein
MHFRLRQQEEFFTEERMKFFNQKKDEEIFSAIFENYSAQGLKS